MRKEKEMLAKQGQADSVLYRELAMAIKTESASVKKNKTDIEALRRQMSISCKITAKNAVAFVGKQLCQYPFLDQIITIG